MPPRRRRSPGPTPTRPESVLPHRERPDGIEVRVHVRPGARREAVGGVHGDALAVRVRAAAREGAANDAVSRALARAFGVAPTDVELISGHGSRRKRVRLRGAPAELARRLARLAAAQRPV